MLRRSCKFRTAEIVVILPFGVVTLVDTTWWFVCSSEIARGRYLVADPSSSTGSRKELYFENTADSFAFALLTNYQALRIWIVTISWQVLTDRYPMFLSFWNLCFPFSYFLFFEFFAVFKMEYTMPCSIQSLRYSSFCKQLGTQQRR